MKKSKEIVRVVTGFFTWLIVGLLIVFFGHVSVLETKNSPLFNDKIILSYILNGIVAIVIFLVLFFLRKKQKDQLGFLFMFGSFLKFALFFVFFYPAYNADGKTTRLEFMAFFIPYVYSLLIETSSLIKLLNLPEKTE